MQPPIHPFSHTHTQVTYFILHDTQYAHFTYIHIIHSLTPLQTALRAKIRSLESLVEEAKAEAAASAAEAAAASAAHARVSTQCVCVCVFAVKGGGGSHITPAHMHMLKHTSRQEHNHPATLSFEGGVVAASPHPPHAPNIGATTDTTTGAK